MAIELTNENFKQVVQESIKPVVVDVHAQWCGPCQYMAPIFEELEQELSDTITFAKLDVDEARETSMACGITSVPTFLIFKNGSIASRKTGSMSQDNLRSWIQEYL